MTEAEFGKIAVAMKSIYTDPKFLPDKYAISVWYNMLKDLSNAECQAAVSEYIATKRFAPTVADIRELATKHAEPDEDAENAEIAWSHVSRAIQNGNYGAEKEFERLTPTEQKAIGSSANIRELAQMDVDTVNSVEKSHFIRNFRAVVSRKKDDAKIPPQIASLIDKVSAPKIESSEQKAETARPMLEHKREMTDNERSLSRYYREALQ